jgi:hypothetical protein
MPITTPSMRYLLTNTNKVIKKDNQEGNHNITLVSINSYKLNVKIAIKEKSRIIGVMHQGLPFSGKDSVCSQLDACGPPYSSWTCSYWISDSGSTRT